MTDMDPIRDLHEISKLHTEGLKLANQTLKVQRQTIDLMQKRLARLEIKLVAACVALSGEDS